MKVSIVGPIKENAKKGQTNPKIFLYQKSLEKMGYETRLFSTALPKYKIISLYKNFKNALKYGDSIFLMFGGNACRKLISPLLHLNKKYKKRLILCPFGTGPLNPLLRNKSVEFTNKFINELNFGYLNDKKVEKNLKKLDCVVLQNDVLNRCFASFYHLSNTKVLRNFREPDLNECNYNYKDRSIIFISRVVKEKGILDLMQIVDSINKVSNDKKLLLDIYGEKKFEDNDNALFNSLLSNEIKYFGPIPNNQVQRIISEHAVSCLPTRHNGEGTPGFIIESLLAGVPIIVSSFSQVNSIVKDSYDSVVFNICDLDDLKNKLIDLIYDKKKINKYRENAFNSGKQYTFESNIHDIKLIVEGKNN